MAPILVQRSSFEELGAKLEKGGETMTNTTAAEGTSAVVLTDIYRPFSQNENDQDEESILRIRSIFVGCILGIVVNASNVYLGLKTGITFPANLFGAIIGFAFIKSLTRAIPETFPILGGHFGPKENNIIQTSATAAGGLSNIFISAFPALYQMGLLHDPVRDYAKICCITLGMAFIGFFAATPLRRLFIVKLARELRLVFPSATATATTIRAMHAATSGGSDAMKKCKVLGVAFLLAMILRVVSSYATGILWNWHIFTWFYIWGNYSNAAIWAENWGWYIELTPAINGAGMIVGLNTALSMFGSTVMCYAIIGPLLVKYGAASGVKIMGPNATGHWKDLTTYFSMNLKDPINNPSPRYWLLWPGVLLMVTVAIVEFLSQYKTLTVAFKTLAMGARNVYIAIKKRLGRDTNREKVNTTIVEDGDFATPQQQIPAWMWLTGLFLAIIVTCLSAGLQWDVPLGMNLLAIVLSVMFSLIALLSLGMTDMTPLTAVSKSAQLVLGAVTRGTGDPLPKAQTINSIGGALASGIANQAVDLTADFRTGFLLSTPPKAQWIAQGIGSVCAVFVAPALFLVFAKAYPCILDLNAETCAFSAPSVAAWRAATIVSTSPTLPIPLSSGIFAICISVVGAATVIFKNFYLVGERDKYRNYLPNFLAVGIMMVVPQPAIGIAMISGAIIAALWRKFRFVSYEKYIYSVAAGMIAGEGVGGIINAIIAIAGVTYQGTTVACPAGNC